MPGGNTHGCRLELQKNAAHIHRNGKFRKAGASLLRQVIRHFHVNLIGGRTLGTRPTFIDDLNEFLRNIDAPPVIPTILEPLGELGGGIVIEDIHVQFALVGEAGQREIAGAEKSRYRIIRVGAETKVEFGVERVAKEELDDNFPCFELSREPPKSCFVCVVGCTDGELCAKLLCETTLEANDCLLADLIFSRQESVCETQFILSKALHSDEEATLGTFSARPFLDESINRFPSAQIEVADAKI